MAKYTKSAISNSLLELIKDKALNDITVNDITEHANMNRKTFYSHFHSIPDLLKYILAQSYSSIKFLPVSLSSWRQQAQKVLSFIKENKYFFKAMFYSRYYAELHLYLKDFLYDIIKEYENIAWDIYFKENKEDIDNQKRDYIAKFYTGAIHTIIDEWFLKGMKESVDDMIITLSILLKNSIYNAYDSFLNKQ